MAEHEEIATLRLIPFLATPGELLDRITILRIRSAHAPSAQREAALAALERAESAWARAGIDVELGDLTAALLEVNQSLWEAEGRIRNLEQCGDLGREFVGHALAIVRLNDQRAAIKREISALCGLLPADDVKLYAS